MILYKIRANIMHKSFVKTGGPDKGKRIKILDSLIDIYERRKYKDLFRQAEEHLKELEDQKDFIEYALDRVETMKI